MESPIAVFRMGQLACEQLPTSSSQAGYPAWHLRLLAKDAVHPEVLAISPWGGTGAQATRGHTFSAFWL